MRCGDRRGVALIFVLWLLVLLGVIVAEVVSQARTEAQILSSLRARPVISASGEQQVALEQGRMLILFRGPNAYELLDRARTAGEAGSETGRVPWQVHLGQQRRLDRQVRGWRQRRSVGRARSKRLEWKELVVPPTRLRRGVLVTDEKGGEVRLERGVEVEVAIVKGLLKHPCLPAVDDGAPAIRRVRRKGIFPARVAECHVVRPIPTDAQRSGANPQWIGNTDAVQANRTRLARRPPADVGLEK